MISRSDTRAGPLERANKVTLPRNEPTGSSVFTLHHWDSNKTTSEVNRSGPTGRKTSTSMRRKSISFAHNGVKNVRLLSIKVQEMTMNFLSRWVLMEESEREAENIDWRRQEITNMNMGRRKSLAATLASETGFSPRRKSSSLLGEITKLPDRRLTSVAKYVFWRWLTWTNFFEMILIILLIICCIYQCYELLEDYFSYPTHVGVNKVLNENYLTDLPALTICNKNRMSKETLRVNYPDLNESHFMAMTLGTFYSVNNFTLMRPGEEYFLDDNLDDYEGSSDGVEGIVNATRGPTTTRRPPKSHSRFNASDIDWIKVSRFLTKNTLANTHKTRPMYDMIETIGCANIWGDKMPCEKFRRLESLQKGSLCITLFHDSMLWDPRDQAVKDLELALGADSPSARSAEQVGADLDEVPLLNLNAEQLDESEWAKLEESNETKVHVELGNMEMIRLRINFRPDDYANKRSVVGALLAVHQKSYIANINHIAYNIEPGFWYSYYLERFDYERLPPPYKTNCYDYQRNRYDWPDRVAKLKLRENRAHIHRLIERQAARPGKVLQEYADNLRARSMGKVS